MKLITRKFGSSRASAPKHLEFEPNWCGQGGYEELTLKIKTNDLNSDYGQYLLIKFESREEVRELLSQAQIVWHNYNNNPKNKESKNG